MLSAKSPSDLTSGTWLEGWLGAVRGAKQRLESLPEKPVQAGDADWARTVLVELAAELENRTETVSSGSARAPGDRSPASWRTGHREGLSSALQVYRRRLEGSERGDEPLDDQLTVDLLHLLVAEMTAAVKQASHSSLF